MAHEKTTSPSMAAEYTIEIAAGSCRNVVWPMTRDVLRGRWTRDILIGQHAPPALQQMPDVPGQRIHINWRQRLVRIYDPLSLPENAQLLRDVKAMYKELLNVDGRPADEIRREWPLWQGQEAMNQEGHDQLKSTLYWMKRFVNDKLAVEIGVPLPSLNEIALLPGRTLIEPFNNDPHAWRYQETPTRKDMEELMRQRGQLVIQEVAHESVGTGTR